MRRSERPRRRGWLAVAASVGLYVGCSDAPGDVAATLPPPTAARVNTFDSTAEVTVPTPSPSTTSTTVGLTTTTVEPALEYAFPFVGQKVSYGSSHHDYPATDVFGCGAFYIAPTSGMVLEISTVDVWDPDVNDPATRGGLYVSLLGDDGVRYYAAHLEQVLVESGQVVPVGEPLGVIGDTGNARASECHLHFGISRPCENPEWAVRRGEIWPYSYLDAWRAGEMRSPVWEIVKATSDVPGACEFAEAVASG